MHHSRKNNKKKENYLSDRDRILYAYNIHTFIICKCMRRLSNSTSGQSTCGRTVLFVHKYSASENRNFEIFISRSCEVQIFLKISAFQCVTRWGFFRHKYRNKI